MTSKTQLVAVARGDAPADRFVRGATVVNVYSGELLPANVAIAEGRIAYVGSREDAIGPATEVIEARGLYLAPGWIEPHAHPWALYNPVSMAEGILPGGTTLVFNDNLFFYLQAGPEGFPRLLDALAELPIRYRWLVRLMSQSEWAGEADFFAPEKVMPLLARPEVAGTAEATRWPRVFRGEPVILSEIAQAHALGKRSDGHTAGASYEKLNAVAAGGISACHEAITRQEILDRLRLGLWTMLRHSSIRPDLPELAKAITESKADTRRLMLTVDGPAPRFIAEGGFIDEALREIVRQGVAPVQAIQMATINPATYYRLDHELGGIAPGRMADLVLLPDLESFRPLRVMVGGRDVARNGRLVAELPRIDWDGLGMRPQFADLMLNHFTEDLPVIDCISNVITRPGGSAADSILAVLLDRAGQWATAARLHGFAPRLSALASTYNTATQLLLLGSDRQAMRQAAASVIRNGGALADSGGVYWEIALPITGMMSPLPFADVVRANRELEQHVRSAGFPFADILYALLFLTCDFLPGLRLTARGVLDVKKGEIIRPAQSREAKL
jgi:adenine deaminase